MSDAHESHTGPIKTPRQFLWVALVAFVLPVILIIGLVVFVTQADKPSAGAVNQELATAIRIQPVGSVALRDTQRVLQTGDAVYKMQCAACHDAGVVGAPKFGVVGDWSPRLGRGLESLVNSTLKGKGAMGAQSGGAFEDVEIIRAVVFLANAGGGTFAEPAPPAPAQ